MIQAQTDSLTLMADSANIVMAKPMMLKDTIVAEAPHWSLIDTVTNQVQNWILPDSAKLISHLSQPLPVPTGFAGVPLPSLPQNEMWVFLVLVFLFFTLVVAFSHSSGILTELLKPFTEITERSSIFTRKTINDLRFNFFLSFFSIGIFSLFAFINLKDAVLGTSFENYCYFLVISSLFFIGKKALIDLVGNVFVAHKELKIAKESYFNIVSTLGICLFPITIAQIYIPSSWHIFPVVMGGVFLAIAAILVIIKLFQIFYHKLVASFYILLYLCTLEIIPLFLLIWVFRKV